MNVYLWSAVVVIVPAMCLYGGVYIGVTVAVLQQKREEKRKSH